MPFVLSQKYLRCPQCQHEGPSRVIGVGNVWWVLWLALFFTMPGFTIAMFLSDVSAPVAVLPLVIVALGFIWLVMQPVEQVCAKCGSADAAPPKVEGPVRPKWKAVLYAIGYFAAFVAAKLLVQGLFGAWRAAP